MIRELLDSHCDYVKQVISQNKLVYGDFELRDALNTHFFEVVDFKTQKFVGFFGLAVLDEVKDKGLSSEMCLCYVFIKPNCRRHGYFNEIVDFSKKIFRFNNHNENIVRLSINASSTLEPANTIYNKKFTYLGEQLLKGEKCKFYLIDKKDNGIYHDKSHQESIMIN